MIITLFNNFSKRENSTKQPNDGIDVECYLKNDTSILTPSFILDTVEISYTYLKWESRYYYITDKISKQNSSWELQCEIDVLSTWKSQILNTRAFVKYSTSNYDTDIPDMRLSTKKDVTVKTNTKQLFKFLNVYAYVLTYISSQPNFGGSAVGVLSQSGLERLMQILTDSNYTDYIANTLKSLMNVYDSVLSCIALPIAPDIVSVIDNVTISGFSTGITGAKPNYTTTFTASVEIPWIYTDFRNRSQYTSIIMSIPCVGTVQLNADDFLGKTNITVKAVVDNLTGDTIVYIDDGYMKLTTNIATPIAIGTSKTNSLGVVAGVISAGASLLQGAMTRDFSGLGSSAFNAVTSSLQRDVGMIGSNGSFANSINYNDDTRGYITIKCISHDTTIDPYAGISTQGFPLNKVTSLSSLTGYVECANASVSCNAPVELKNKINNYLNGGIYIE